MAVHDTRWICWCGAAHAVLLGVGYAAAKHLLLTTVLYLRQGTPLICNPRIKACSHSPPAVLQLQWAQRGRLQAVPVPVEEGGERQHKVQVQRLK
jgi:hypothetical protein